MNKRTLYLSVKSPLHSALDAYPNAGPGPSIKGMRSMYWGKKAYLIRSGQYVYKVSYELFHQALAWNMANGTNS